VKRKRGRSARRELGPGMARLPSHDAVVQRHPGPPVATRLPMLSLYSRRLLLLVAVVQLTRMQRQCGAHAHLHQVVAPRVSCLLTLMSLRSSISILPLPALVYCVYEHLLIATHRTISSCYASPRILRIGSGAGNHRGLAHCAGFGLHSS
jgi:hypothetical protein